MSDLVKRSFGNNINEEFNYTCLPYKVDTESSIFINGQNSQNTLEPNVESTEVLLAPFIGEEHVQQTATPRIIIHEAADIENSPEAQTNFTAQDYESTYLKDNSIDLDYALYVRTLWQHVCTSCQKVFSSSSSSAKRCSDESVCANCAHNPGGLRDDANRHACSHCDKSFTNSAGLKRHSRIHTGERPYLCQICDKSFSQQSNLWKHVRTHTGECPYECPHCSRKFSQKANMRKHLLVHTGEKPFPCKVCERSFTQRANLAKHMRLHSGEKPYACDYCDKTFSQRSNLHKHRYLHEGHRPYGCDVCHVHFAKQSNLRKHQNGGHQHNSSHRRSHHRCDSCHKEYAQKVALLRHQQSCCVQGVFDPSKLLFDHENELSNILNSVSVKIETDMFESEG